ncbi:MAG: hypothetical protein CM1200mP20_08250 [Pseudomonadota bacterium]|nr:MAG: hypothetical protein CM1200mP20_08250 [Pseudomonadota bacterium]
MGTFALNLGLKYSNPVNVTVIATTIPLFSVLLGTLKGEEKLTTRMAVAIGLAIRGVLWSPGPVPRPKWGLKAVSS